MANKQRVRRVRSIAEKLTRKVEIKLDSQVWQIVITHNVLIECEQLTGLNMLAGEVNLVRPSFTLVRALLFLALKHAGADYTLEEVGEMIHPGNLVEIQKALLTAWTASMPDVDLEAALDRVDPTRATASG